MNPRRIPRRFCDNRKVHWLLRYLWNTKPSGYRLFFQIQHQTFLSPQWSRLSHSRYLLSMWIRLGKKYPIYRLKIALPARSHLQSATLLPRSTRHLPYPQCPWLPRHSMSLKMPYKNYSTARRSCFARILCARRPPPHTHLECEDHPQFSETV